MSEQSFKSNARIYAAKKSLERAQEVLRYAMQEMQISIDALDAAESDEARARIMSNAINYLAVGIMPNVRIDMLANVQAEFKAGATESKEQE